MENNEQGMPLDIITANPTKSVVKQMAKEIADQVREGYIDPISISVRAAAMISFCEELRKEIEPTVTDLLVKTKEAATWGGATIEAAEVGTKYDYSGNDEWVRLKEEEAAIADKRKAIEEKMKKIPQGQVLVDEETGDTMTGAIKSSKSSYKINLGK